MLKLCGKSANLYKGISISSYLNILHTTRNRRNYFITKTVLKCPNSLKNHQVLPMLVGVGASFSINNHLYSGDYLFQVIISIVIVLMQKMMQILK